MRPRYILPIHDLDSSGRSLSTKLEVEWLKEALDGVEIEPSDEPGQIDIRYSKTAKNIVIRGSLHVDVKVPCARCLAPAPVHIETEISLMLVPADSPKANFAKGKGAAPGEKDSDYEFKDADAELDTYSGEEVVLDEFLREAIVLEIPSFPLCTEDCSGIARDPASGPTEPTDTVDPRFARLRELLKKPNLRGIVPPQTQRSELPHGRTQATNNPFEA